MFAIPWEDSVTRRLEGSKWRYLKLLFDTLDASFGSWMNGTGTTSSKQAF